MIRSVRGGVVAVLFLVAAGCGGGTTEAADAGHDARPDLPPPVDVGPDDRAPPDDGPPQDVVVPPDGPSCDPGGGHVTGSPCVIDLDCACPRTCVRLRPGLASGACWLRCDASRTNPATGANPDCQADESCLPGEGTTGGCLPRGPLGGSFDVPMYQAPAQPAGAADLGTAAVTLEVGLIGQMVFESGWGTTANDGVRGVYRLYLYPGSGATVDWDKPLVVDFAADASYLAGASYDLAATPATARVEYHEYTRQLQVIFRDVLRAMVPTGTVHLTAAGTAARAHATGTITGASAIEYEAEVCSNDSAMPCQ